MRIIVLITVLLAGGCDFVGIVGSGNVATRQLQLDSFDKIDVGSTFNVDVTQGEAYSVLVSADDNLWDYVDARIDGKTLHLTLKGTSFNNTHVSANVVLPHLVGLEVSGAGKAVLHGISESTSEISLSASGASRIDGDIHAQKLALDLSGASHMTLTGQADTLSVDASGASHAALKNLLSHDTHAKLSGASGADLNSTGDVRFDISGASHLSNASKPKSLSGDSSGASSVHSE